MFANYSQLIQKVEAMVNNIVSRYNNEINCEPGCSDCCKEFSIFPIEAHYIQNAFKQSNIINNDSKRLIIKNIENKKEGCPLLHNKFCLMYDFRPIICRTHGYPILYNCDGENKIDFCSKNFNECEKIEGSYIINLDILNTILVALNEEFCLNLEEDKDKRYLIRDILDCKLIN